MNPELEKYVLDEKFVSWVLDPSGIYAEYWKQYFTEMPHEEGIANEAANLIRNLHQAERENYRQVKEEVLQATWKNIENELRVAGPDIQNIKKHRNNIHRIVAAAAILFAVAFFFYSTLGPHKNIVPVVAMNGTNHHAKQTITNATAQFKLIHLSDGTSINLAPNASIITEKIFGGSKREVTLNGNAFFHVAKDASKPFYVYTGSVVTRVVGTSFSIVTKNGSNDVAVCVKTGKVMVYKKGNEQKPSAVAVLLPTQQCVYSSTKDIIETGNSPDGDNAVIQPNETTQSFERATIPNILTAISNRFNIEIKYNAADFKGTDITITLQPSQSLENMLHVICKTVNAKYSIQEGKIFFTTNK